MYTTVGNDEVTKIKLTKQYQLGDSTCINEPKIMKVSNFDGLTLSAKVDDGLEQEVQSLDEGDINALSPGNIYSILINETENSDSGKTTKNYKLITLSAEGCRKIYINDFQGNFTDFALNIFC